MADVKIDLQVAHKEFLTSLEQTAKSIDALIKAANSLNGSQDKLKRSADDLGKSQKSAADGADRHTRALESLDKGLKTLGSSISKTIAFYALLYEAGKKAFSIAGDVLKSAVENIDEFNKSAIGTAAAITNIADTSAAAGKTYNDIFLQNLNATKGTFIELERLAARYFASSIDLQLAYNTFAQRGVVIRKTELEQLAQLTDLILLLTGGQLSTIQIQEEIRSLMNGNLRATSQLAQLIKAFGADVKEVGQQIRVTQSLQPLQGILVGARAATGEIQKTYQATLNGLETLLRQLGRVAGAGFFSSLTSSVQRFTAFLDRNKEQIGGVAAAIGKLVGSGLERVEKFLEVFLNTSNVEKSVGAYIRMAAVLQTVGSALFRIVEITTIVLRNLPAAVQAFTDALEFANMDPVTRELKKGEKEITATIERLQALAQDPGTDARIKKLAESQITNLHGALATIEAQLDAQTPIWDKLTKKAQSFFGQFVPGFTESKGVLAGVVKGTEALLTDLDKLEKFEFGKQVEENFKAIRGAVQKFKNEIKVLTEPSGVAPVAGRVPFTPSEEQLGAQIRLTHQLEDATVRLARAKRQEREQEQAQDVEIGLQALRRRFALIEQGFILTGRGIQELRSVSDEVNKFIGQNTSDLSRGIQLSYGSLFAGIGAAVESLISGKFANLKAQLDTTTAGFAKFKKEAIAAGEELANAEAAPHETRAKEILGEAKKNLEGELKILNDMVEQARTKFDKAQGADNIKAAAAELREAQDKLVQGQKTAFEIFNFQAQNAAIEEQTAMVKRLTVEQQTQVRINAENKKIREDQLRIEQQLLQEAGRLGQAVQGSRAQVVQAQQRAAAGQPRTELETERSALEADALQVSSGLEATRAGLNQLTVEASALAEAGVAGATETLAFLDAQLMSIDALRQQHDAAVAAARENINMKVTLDALGNATRSTLNTFVDSILGAFEGKKTNFLQAFKGIADNLVKDSLKSTFDSLATGLQKGFKDVFGDLTKSLPQSLQSTLGPAFMAGIGLIASFVLGQLMGDQGGEASAANPQVGIQSAEQVRGIIGGETQIPIGAVAESLQDALVTTNGLLMRIALGVENISFSGADFEQSLTNAFGSTLQTQG